MILRIGPIYWPHGELYVGHGDTKNRASKRANILEKCQSGDFFTINFKDIIIYKLVLIKSAVTKLYF